MTVGDRGRPLPRRPRVTLLDGYVKTYGSDESAAVSSRSG
jgi:hypothetical protein